MVFIKKAGKVLTELRMLPLRSSLPSSNDLCHMFISDGCCAVTRFVAFSCTMSIQWQWHIPFSLFLSFTWEVAIFPILMMYFVYISYHNVVETIFFSVRSLGDIISCHIVCVTVSFILYTVSPQCFTCLLFLSLVSNSSCSEGFSVLNDGSHLFPHNACLSIWCLDVISVPVCPSARMVDTRTFKCNWYQYSG